MYENEIGRKFVAKWDDSIVVDAYQDGDFMLVVQKNGDFQILSGGALSRFFRPVKHAFTIDGTEELRETKEVEPDG